jgi:hypothetical protein
MSAALLPDRPLNVTQAATRYLAADAAHEEEARRQLPAAADWPLRHRTPHAEALEALLHELIDGPRTGPDDKLLNDIAFEEQSLYTTLDRGLIPIPSNGKTAEPVEEQPSQVPDPDIDTFLNEDEPEYDWVIPDTLEREDRVILTGLEGKGKSTLLRQIALQAATGIHPFTGDPMPAARVLLIDLENSRRQVRRKLRAMRLVAGDELIPANLRIIVKADGIDLLDDREVNWLELRIVANEPEIVIIGPLYKLHGGDPTEEKPAKAVSDVLDRFRVHYGFALLMETHCPHAVNGKTIERPYGASLWKRWPEFGLYLSPEGQLRHWRGERDERNWPAVLTRGGDWPWTPASDPKAATFAQMIETVRGLGRMPSNRELAGMLGVNEINVRRAIAANDKQWNDLKKEIGE